MNGIAMAKRMANATPDEPAEIAARERLVAELPGRTILVDTTQGYYPATDVLGEHRDVRFCVTVFHTEADRLRASGAKTIQHQESDDNLDQLVSRIIDKLKGQKED